MKITVFTPTYNRAYILPELYKSLQKQTVCDFEWLIVDDGSTDNTEEIVGTWLKQSNPFEIRYIRKENGGKHRAINLGVQNAHGELFFIVDSDDHLTEDAIDTILTMKNSLPTENRFAGVCGCKGKNNGQLLGTTFSGTTLDCTSLERNKYGIDGDKAEAFFTDILKKYPFPEFEGENFVTEAVVWDKIAYDGYRLRFFNKVIYICDYLDDGLTNQGLELYYRNPLGYGCYLRQAREVNKFEKNVQNFFDVECYLHWRDQIGLKEIAELIGTEPHTLIRNAVIYQLRQYGSKCKRSLLNMLKRGKNP